MEWRHTLTQGKIVNFVTLPWLVCCMVFIPVYVGTRSAKIHQKTCELWSKVRWHVIMADGVVADVG